MNSINHSKGAEGASPGHYDWRQLCGPSSPIQFRNEVLSRRIQNALKFTREPYLPSPIQIIKTWKCDGVEGQLISYPSTWGPPTQAYVLKPAGAQHPLPGVLAFHCHGNLKRWGKEKIACDDTPEIPELVAYREKAYGGRPFANELARQGFIVMVPDTFMWGSRALSPADIPSYFTEAGKLLASHARYSAKFPNLSSGPELTAEMARDNYFESEIHKFLQLSSLSLSATVLHDDRNSLRVLRSLSGVRADSIGAIGLSGGGNRVGLLTAVESQLSAGVIVGMMSTYEHLLQTGDYWKHTHMLFPPTSDFIEWPDLVASAAPRDLFCLYNRHDGLFTLGGQEAADKRLRDIYNQLGASESYRGAFFDGHHKFDVPMQEIAFDHLKKVLE